VLAGAADVLIGKMDMRFGTVQCLRRC